MLLFAILGLRRLWSRPWKANRVSLIFWSESEDSGRIPTGEAQLHLSRESPKHGLNMCSREELLVSVCPEPTWDLNRWEVTHSCGKLQTLYMGNEMRGDTLLPVVSPVTHHLLIGVLQVTVAETPVVPSLLCISSTKETKEVNYVSKGTSTMNLKGKQHH